MPPPSENCSTWRFYFSRSPRPLCSLAHSDPIGDPPPPPYPSRRRRQLYYGQNRPARPTSSSSTTRRTGQHCPALFLEHEQLTQLSLPDLLSHSFRLSAAASSSSSSPWPASRHRNLLGSSSPYGGAAWEREVRRNATPRRDGGMSVLVTGAAGFVGAHCALALRARGDGVLGLDNFNAYYDPALKRARQRLLASRGVVVLGADINVASNVVGLVSVFEAAARHADPQPAIVWASSSSVYGLNTDAPFSEEHRTDRPASLYAATKKAGEAIAHAYNHICGLSITGLRFFTVYGPWGRPDMAYFFFARSIVAGEPITLFRAGGKGIMEVARQRERILSS